MGKYLVNSSDWVEVVSPAIFHYKIRPIDIDLPTVYRLEATVVNEPLIGNYSCMASISALIKASPPYSEPENTYPEGQ